MLRVNTRPLMACNIWTKSSTWISPQLVERHAQTRRRIRECSMTSVNCSPVRQRQRFADISLVVLVSTFLAAGARHVLVTEQSRSRWCSCRMYTCHAMCAKASDTTATRLTSCLRERTFLKFLTCLSPTQSTSLPTNHVLVATCRRCSMWGWVMCDLASLLQLFRVARRNV